MSSNEQLPYPAATFWYASGQEPWVGGVASPDLVGFSAVMSPIQSTYVYPNKIRTYAKEIFHSCRKNKLTVCRESVSTIPVLTSKWRAKSLVLGGCGSLTYSKKRDYNFIFFCIHCTLECHCCAPKEADCFAFHRSSVCCFITNNSSVTDILERLTLNKAWDIGSVK